MRTNLPVTGQEYPLSDGIQIVSRTDLKGIITQVNREFVEASGFSDQELLGSPHNILRHPDMPEAVFKDLWSTVQQGKPWSGVIKNRRKNGDYYWAEANVSPLRQGGQVTGYISVRRKPERSDVKIAEAQYQLLRQGKSIRSPLSRLFDSIGNLSIRRALPGGLLIILLLFMGATLQAYLGMRQAVDQLRVYTEDIQVQLAAYNGMFVEGLQMAAAMRFVMLESSDKQARDNVIKAQKAFQEHLATARSLASSQEAKQTLDSIAESRAKHNDIQDRIVSLVNSGDVVTALNVYKAEDNKVWRVYKDVIMAGKALLEKRAVQDRQALSVAVQDAERRTLLFATLAVLFAVTMGIWLVRKISIPLKEAKAHLEAISEGDYATRIQSRFQDELGEMMVALKSMQARLDFDLQETRRIARETSRIKVALDNVSANVMMADNDRRIIYVNRAVETMFKNAEADIRHQLPQFDANRLLGTCIDNFHAAPAHQAGLLASFTSTHRNTLNIGGRTMTVIANPVINEDQERLGAVVEWADRTHEVAVEKEVATLVQAAAAGDFSQRLSLAGKEGFFKQLAEGINRLVETNEHGIQDVARVLKALAEGDLSRRMDGSYQGLFAELKNDVNATSERLAEIVAQIREATDAINTAAREIAAGNADLSSRTESQTSSLEETASSMDELTATVKQNADNSRQANQLAKGASGIAARGGEIVGNVVTTMGAIAESSKKIAEIISVIDGIAFQTNILALNAAVEAARAGEQGRGFAVVAGEVRNLAQRSASAAKEIKELISTSVDKVSDGYRQVETAGQTMHEIVEAVKRVSDIMGEISAASVDQSQGIGQINIAITQMDEMTQQNAALVEEAAASAESLQEQAASLVKAVALFHLAVESRKALPARKPARAQPVIASPMRAAKPVAVSEDDWEEF